ncbi:hypothetical protein CDD82_3755 [Ophiocordyceps australis]|uniref:Uncharacterized protein n=1 Tax=Ophiocordyceps australis TaxID=1399860 RepID=A0A2C5ZAL2_9HYPO|nr:hypothetical protein CDD82_3755 [Ophiocordyceps australis]
MPRSMTCNGDASTVSHADSSAESPPRSASVSLQAAATMNAGLQREPSRQSSNSSLPRNAASPSHNSGRRRSAVLMNLQLNDPNVPAPGEMINEQSSQRPSPQPRMASPRTADPHHHRAPSLGELHQELEAEQEASVNRLLQMIRQQQLELQRLQSSRPLQTADGSGMESAAPDGRERTVSITSQQSSSQIGHSSSHMTGSISRSPGFPPHPRSSLDMARADLHRRSRTPSRGASPRLRATSISAESGEWTLGGRDESALYQAETQMLVRENQMLRHRIRDLEKQVADSTGASSTAEPPVPSHLTTSSTADETEP